MSLSRKKSNLKEREEALNQQFNQLERVVANEEDSTLRNKTLGGIKQEFLAVKQTLKKKKSATQIVPNVLKGTSRDVQVNLTLDEAESFIAAAEKKYLTTSEELRKKRDAAQRAENDVPQKIVQDWDAMALQLQSQPQALPPPPPPPTIVQHVQQQPPPLNMGLSPRPYQAPRIKPATTTPPSSTARKSTGVGKMTETPSMTRSIGPSSHDNFNGKSSLGSGRSQAPSSTFHRNVESVDSTNTQHTFSSVQSTSTVESIASRGTFGVGIDDAIYPSATLKNERELAERFGSLSINTKSQYDPRTSTQRDQQYFGQSRQQQLYTTYHTQQQGAHGLQSQSRTSQTTPQYRVPREPASDPRYTSNLSNPTSSSQAAYPSMLPSGYGANYSPNPYNPQNPDSSRSQYPMTHSSSQLNASSSSSPYPYHMAPTSSNSQPTVFIPPSTTSRYPAEQQRPKKEDWKQNEQRK